MTFAAGALSKVLIGQTTAVLSSAVATGGSSPYTYQWYKSTTTGFTPGAGNIISGATSLSLNDSGNQPGSTVFYVVVVTDTGNANVTVNSSQLTVLQQPAQNQNQFQMSTIVGLVDLRVGPTNVVAAMVDVSIVNSAAPYNVIQAGQGVKIVANTSGGVLKVLPIQSKSDPCIGFVVYNIKDIQYTVGSFSAGASLEIAMWGSVIWLFATGAITQMAQVCLDPTYVGGVQATGATATLVGQAYDGASAAGPIRVMLIPNASFATA